MDFGLLPPEITSGRMYCGPGPESMLQAARAWGALAANLSEAAANCRSAMSKLADEWDGSAATAMMQVTRPYLGWIRSTAAQAEHAASQAAAAASAHESALAAMVPPQEISANRAQRLSLANSNCLGQTGPAIADADTEYERMWTRNADAMYGYARASADASVLTPFTPPPAATDVLTAHGGAPCSPAHTWTLRVGPEIITAASQVISAIPEALDAVCQSPLTSFTVTLSSVTPALSRLASLSAPSDFAIFYLSGLNKAAALACLAPVEGRVNAAACAAALGRGKLIGSLSVPTNWVAETAEPVSVPLQRGWVCEPIHLVDAADPPIARSAGTWHTSTTDNGD